MFQYLEKLDTSLFGRIYRILLAPIWCLQEYICFKKYWKIILSELIENDKIFEFLDRNEFGLENNRIIKKDLINSHEYLQGRTIEECKAIIKREYVSEFSKIIKENCNINIEDLISLIVITDIKVTKNNGEIYRNAIYEVIIQYCRLWWFEKAKKYTVIWLLVINVITLFTVYLIRSI